VDGFIEDARLVVVLVSVLVDAAHRLEALASNTTIRILAAFMRILASLAGKI
jgi:hypothetical protein